MQEINENQNVFELDLGHTIQNCTWTYLEQLSATSTSRHVSETLRATLTIDVLSMDTSLSFFCFLQLVLYVLIDGFAIRTTCQLTRTRETSLQNLNLFDGKFIY